MRNRLIILSLDSALSSCSVSIIEDGEVLCEIFEARMRGQAERLLPMCQEILRNTKLSFDKLDAIGVTRGPGTFTGVRIGLAAAKGLALALHLPLICVTTLEVVARNAFDEKDGVDIGRIAVAHDARRSEIYWQIFERIGCDILPVSEPLAVALSKVTAHLDSKVGLVVGSGVKVLKSYLPQSVFEQLCFPDSPFSQSQPNAGTVGRVAYEKMLSGNDIEAAVPLYLRAPDAIAAKAITYSFQNE